MVREDIIRMAQETGICRLIRPQRHEDMLDMLTHFATLVAAAEREACAQILDHNANACANNSILRDVLQGNATAIRARGSND